MNILRSLYSDSSEQMSIVFIGNNAILETFILLVFHASLTRMYVEEV